MNCQQCNKPEASVQYTEVVGGEKKVEWLCQACAQERGLVVFKLDNAAPPGAAPSPSLSITVSAPHAASGVAERACEACGTTLTAIRRSGRVGCPDCYETFWEHLEPLLRRVHEALEHRSRGAASSDEDGRLARELRTLRRELSDAVRREEFERAARLRDEIARYEAEITAGGGEAC